MSDYWQVYQKHGSRWITILMPMSKDEAETIVAGKKAELSLYEKAVAEAKKHNSRNRHPDPGFREPHCVPV